MNNYLQDLVKHKKRIKAYREPNKDKLLSLSNQISKAQRTNQDCKPLLKEYDRYNAIEYDLIGKRAERHKAHWNKVYKEKRNDYD